MVHWLFNAAEVTDPGSVYSLGAGSPVINHADDGNLGDNFITLC